MTANISATISAMRVALKSRWLGFFLRLTVGIAVLVTVVAYVGTGPLIRGIVSLDLRTVPVVLALAAAATAAAAWRWQVIATRLGVELSWPAAFGRYYQSQFLNTVIPGGIVGDVHRAVSHGQSAGSIARSSRAVVLERITGQAIQMILALGVVAVFAAQLSGYLLAVIGIGLGVAVLVAIVLGLVAWRRPRAKAALSHELSEFRAGLGSVRTVVQVVLASIIVVLCHAATFAIATTSIGVTVPPGQLLVLALLVLIGASIPFNVGGWGPREGVAGWAFAAVGLGSAAGVAASTLFGVLTIIAVAPGAVFTLIYAARRRTFARFNAAAVYPEKVVIP